MSAPLRVFCCYAREDQEMLAHLKKHLALLEHQGQITIWSDTNLDAGVEWEKELHQHLESADIILLLISPDFMDSDYCYSTEMGRAIARHNEGSAVVIPILLRATFWQDAPFAKLQMVPTNTQPVTSWPDWDSALHDITMQINRVVSKLRTKRTQVEADKPTIALEQRTSNQILLSPSLASSEQSRGQPILLQGSGGSSSSHRSRPFHGWRIFLGPLIVCLILGGSVAVFRIWEGPSHATTTQTCQRGTATPSIASSYDIAVAKSGIQFGFNAQHTRTNPYEYILNPDNAWKLQQKWAYLISSAIDSSSPAVANGLVYVGSQDDKLYAFDAATGHQQWCASTGGTIDSSPAVANGFVYVGSQDGNLYAFDAATGKKKGVANVGNSTSSSPTIANGLIYIGSDNGNLYAFDAAIAGQSNWVPKWVAATNPSTRTKQKGIASSPAVANGLVYVSSRDGKLYAFNASTGQPKWVAATKGVIDSSPAVANGFVYVGSQDGKLYAFDASTGQPKWSALTGAIHDSSPAVANNLVYVGSWENHSLYVFDAATGQPKWVASTGDAIYSSPVVANGLVYVGSFDGKLYAFDAATGGQPKWSAFASSAPGKQGIDSSPAVANGFVYVGSRDGKLYAFSLS